MHWLVSAAVRQMDWVAESMMYGAKEFWTRDGDRNFKYTWFEPRTHHTFTKITWKSSDALHVFFVWAMQWSDDSAIQTSSSTGQELITQNDSNQNLSHRLSDGPIHGHQVIMPCSNFEPFLYPNFPSPGSCLAPGRLTAPWCLAAEVGNIVDWWTSRASQRFGIGVLRHNMAGEREAPPSYL